MAVQQRDNRSTTPATGNALNWSQVSSASFRREAADTFHSIDLNKDGKISAHELATLLQRIRFSAEADSLGLESRHMAENDLMGVAEDIVLEADVDGDGLIDFEEFLLAARGGPSIMRGSFKDSSNGRDNLSEGEMEGDLFRAFEVFDLDGDGVICTEELRFVMGALNGDEVTTEDCEQMIKRVDTDGDGYVDYNEFKKMMAGVFA